MIQIYLNKCKNDKKDIIKSNNIGNNLKDKIDIKIKQKQNSYSINNYLNTIKEIKNIFEFVEEGEKEDNFGIKMETKIELEENIIKDEIISNSLLDD